MRLRDVAIRNVASPYGLVAASFLVFLTAYFFPPGAYSIYLQERDYLFLDPATLLFYVACTLAFVVGLIFRFGTNYLLDAKLVDLLFVVATLSIHESLFSRAGTEMFLR